MNKIIKQLKILGENRISKELSKIVSEDPSSKDSKCVITSINRIVHKANLRPTPTLKETAQILNSVARILEKNGWTMANMSIAEAISKGLADVNVAQALKLDR